MATSGKQLAQSLHQYLEQEDATRSGPECPTDPELMKSVLQLNEQGASPKADMQAHLKGCSACQEKFDLWRKGLADENQTLSQIPESSVFPLLVAKMRSTLALLNVEVDEDR